MLSSPTFRTTGKFRNRLTINFGLRYDWETNPIEVHNLFYQRRRAALPTQFRERAARLRKTIPPTRTSTRGSAWHGMSSATTRLSLRAGFGIFHDPYTTYDFSSAYVSTPPYDTRDPAILHSRSELAEAFCRRGDSFAESDHGHVLRNKHHSVFARIHSQHPARTALEQPAHGRLSGDARRSPAGVPRFQLADTHGD